MAQSPRCEHSVLGLLPLVDCAIIIFSCMNFRALLLVCFFFIPAVAQDKIRQTETLSTASKIVVAHIEKLEIKGSAVFTLVSVNQDGTLVGNLVYSLPEADRTKISQALNQPVTNIPANLISNNIAAKFGKAAHCPDMILEIEDLDLDLNGTKFHLNHFPATLVETQSKLSRALCIWTDRINKGITNKGVVQYINLLLKGEEEEKSQ
jgi:hypothetical protein